MLFGPTAVGKTAMTLALFRKNYEIINSDSVQVYKHLDIASAKPDDFTQKEIRHHLIDILEPYEQFTVGTYCQMAEHLVDDILSRGSYPLLTGGTAYYFRQFLYGVASTPESDPFIRDRVKNEIDEKGKSWAYSFLKDIDLQSAERINPNDIPITTTISPTIKYPKLEPAGVLLASPVVRIKNTSINTNTPTIPTDLTLYYTTDPAATELSGETTNQEVNTNPDTNASLNTTLDTINTITWHELDLNNLITTNPDSIKLDNTDPNNPKLTITIPEDYLVAVVGNANATTTNTNEGNTNSIDILAFRLTKDTLSTNQQLNLSPTLTNIITTPNTTISNNITYLSWYDGTNIQTVTNTNNQDTTFNTSIGISLSNPNLTTTINPGSVVLGSSSNTATTNNLSTNVQIKAKTINGYTLTLKATSPNGELIRQEEARQDKGSNEENNKENNQLDSLSNTETNQLTNTIPSLATEPSATTTSWAVQVLGSNTLDSNTWYKLPGASNDPLSLHKVDSYGNGNTTITTNYGIGVNMSTMAGTYRTELVYTVTEV